MFLNRSHTLRGLFDPFLGKKHIYLKILKNAHWVHVRSTIDCITSL